ncbi:Motility protein B [bioreactor metagenome]|uniref:Motility protein B n=1 Tax=bioreactor metagenome TaxID=1076179 RepID=A0A644TFM6_9ZZZZ|nr:flagellar motor protein MotB [Negativicutes bacterium]
MGRRKRHLRQHEEEHMDETWLVPYSDILTLLLALFIVLFASAQVDQKKFDQIAQAFNAAFHSGTPYMLEGNPNPVNGQPAPMPMLAGEGKDQAYMIENTQLIEVKRTLDKYIQENNLTGDLQTVMTEEGLMIRIKDTALFPSGTAELLPESRRFGAVIAKMLTPLQQQIIISGHTDNVPINTREFPSNWDLSSKRALNFMKLLLSQENLQPQRFSAIGYGEYRPVMVNDTEEGRANNRRVEVLIQRSYRMQEAPIVR